MKVKVFNHGSQGQAYCVTGLTDKEYNKLYLSLCDKFWKVDQSHAHIVSNGMQGYILCKDPY